jgi:hypothetical protein
MVADHIRLLVNTLKHRDEMRLHNLDNTLACHSNVSTTYVTPPALLYAGNS